MMLEYFESEAIPPDIDSRVKPLSYTRKRFMVDCEKIDHGIEAVYIPIDAIIGMKLYRSIKAGKLAHQCQTEAAFFEVGPEVFSPLREFVFPMGTARDYPVLLRKFPVGKAYGYYTQVANTRDVSDMLYKDKDLLEDFKAKCMELLSFRCCDVHDRNLGIIDNRLVMIDFGLATTGIPTNRTLGHFSIKGTDRESAGTPNPNIIIES